MNIPQLMERAVATELRKLAGLSGVAVRCWRTPSDTPEVDGQGNLILPMVGVTAETPTVNEQYMRALRVSLTVITRAADDLLRERLTEIETALIDYAEGLDNSTHGYGTSTEITAIRTALANAVHSVQAGTLEPGSMPASEGGANMSTVTIKITYNPHR